MQTTESPTYRKRTMMDQITELAALLEDHNGMVRQRARRALVSLGLAAAPALREALDSPKTVLRWEAAKAFTEMQDPEAAPGLVGTLEDQDEDVRWLAAEALAKLGRPGLRPLLGALVKHTKSAWLREGAHHILRGVKDDELVPVVTPVLDALDHYEPELAVPYAAEQALNRLASMEDSA